MTDESATSMHLQFSDMEFPGIFITLCGLDGSGKTTMIDALRRDLLRGGHDVFLTKQPTDAVRQSPLFDTFVRTDNTEGFEYRSLSLLTISDRVQHSLQVILPELQKGKIVISDRYYFSALVNLRARGYREDKWIYEIATFLPKPDAAIFLEVPFETSLARIRARADEQDRFIDIEFNKALHSEYQYVRDSSDNAIHIDSSGKLEETFEHVKRHIGLAMQAKGKANPWE